MGEASRRTPGLGSFTAAAAVVMLLAGAGSAGGRDLALAVEEYLQVWAEIGDFSGCAGLRRGEESVVRCVGLANRDLEVANTPATRFRIGSVSKQFTAAAILKLEEQGRLAVEDRLARHLPGYPRGGEITVHHLLTHTAGLPELFALPDFAVRRMFPARPADWVERLAARPLQFEPGARFSYSNSGFVALAHLVEKLSGLRFAEFVRREIFEPLGMNGSAEADPGRVMSGRASGYDPAGWRGAEPVAWSHPSDGVGAGSLVSTVPDLLRWSESMRARRGALSRASWERLLTDHGHGYGYGIALLERSGRPVAGHDGRMPGFIAAVDSFLEEPLSIVFAANLQTGNADRLRRDLTALALGEERVEPARPIAGEPHAGAVDFEPLVGDYGFGPSMLVTVAQRDGRLFARANQSAFSELVPLGAGEFFNRATYAGVAFELPPDGPATAMLWRQGGGEFRGERVGGR